MGSVRVAGTVGIDIGLQIDGPHAAVDHGAGGDRQGACCLKGDRAVGGGQAYSGDVDDGGGRGDVAQAAVAVTDGAQLKSVARQRGLEGCRR